MSDERSLEKQVNWFNGFPFILLILEIFFYMLFDLEAFRIADTLILKAKTLYLFQEGNILITHCIVLFLVIVSSIGTKPKKQLEIKTSTQIILPITTGLIFFFGALFFYYNDSNTEIGSISFYEYLFTISSFIGAILINLGADNISKIIRVGFMKDRFNVENESYEQSTEVLANDYSINLPMVFYYKKKMHKGWFNITNPFRGILLIGTPESGKSFSIIIPTIKTYIHKNFTSIIYDYKYPALGEIAYYHHRVKQQNDPDYKHDFHVINLSDVTKSRRINPLHPDYLTGLPQCMETAEALIKALQQSGSAKGAERFFQRSAINFLGAIFYFLSQYKGGIYSTLPHSVALMSLSYEDVFTILMSMDELDELMAPFKDAHTNKTYQQLDGQIGTLRIELAPINTPEASFILSGNDFDLRVSSKNNPAHLIIANDTETENVTAAANSLILNRLSKLVNKPGNLPVLIAVDELPTIYFHKIQNLIATARSNKVIVLLGLQELTQLIEAYTKTVADTITSVCGNIISGQVQKSETVEWLQKMFGKVKQVKKGLSISKKETTVSLNEQMDYLITPSKISSQRTGEVVAKLARGLNPDKEEFDITNTYNCRIDLDIDAIKKEETAYIGCPTYYTFKNEATKQTDLRKHKASIKNDIQDILEEIKASQKNTINQE